jgi:hypothetical protein
MPLIPHRALVRMEYPCRHVAGVPTDGKRLLDLPESCRLDAFAALDDAPDFADVRVAWNELGLAVQVRVRGKERPASGDAAQPRLSDGVTVWIDTRGDRTGHRATRTCHQFHFLPAGGGPDREDPAVVQTKINRAMEDAPLVPASNVPFRCSVAGTGYEVEAFLPATALNGFDPEEHPRLGFFSAVRDAELGEQLLGVGPDYPFAEDPSLWATLVLVRGEK